MNIDVYTSLGIPAAACYLLAKLCSRPVEELGEILADRVRVWRRKNQAAILEEAGEYALRAQLELKEMPLKVLLPLLEGASAEEEPMLRTLWARLLANASATAASVSICGIAGELLRALSPSDAKILDALFREVEAPSKNSSLPLGIYRGVPHSSTGAVDEGPFRQVPREQLLGLTGLSREEFEVCYDNITRFNVIESPQHHNLDGRELERDHYAFTRLGWRVMSLLRPAGPSTSSG